MRYIKPHYYEDFQCIADKCPDSCCAGWQIMIDEQTLEKYNQCEDAFTARIKTSIDWEEGCFLQNNHRCAMLNENNLCDLITAKGEGWLCKTCDQYPRHTEEFDGVREFSLSISCPVVAQMILNMQEPVTYLVEEDEEEEPLAEEFEDFDFCMFHVLEDAREDIFHIVQNRELSIGRRLTILMEMAEQIQACVDEGRIFDIENIMDQYSELDWAGKDKPNYEPKDNSPNKELREEYEYSEEEYQRLKSGFRIFYDFERLREVWYDVISITERTLYTEGYEVYKANRQDFFYTFVKEFGLKKWDIFKEQILMFFLYTYFCGAVYDNCVYSKIALSVFSLCYIEELIICRWLLGGKEITLNQCIDITYQYAREVEHSDENLKMLEEWLMEVYDRL